MDLKRENSPFILSAHRVQVRQSLKISNIETFETTCPQDLIQASILDYPRPHKLLFGQKMIVSGWILSSTQEVAPIQVIATNASGSYLQTLNVERPDVIRSVLKTAPDIDLRLRCGFKIVVPTNDVTEIHVVAGGRRMLKWRIELQEVTSETSQGLYTKVTDFLTGFRSIDARDLETLKQETKTFDVDDLRMLLAEHVTDVSVAQCAQKFTADKQAKINQFLNKVTDPDTLTAWIRTSLDADHIVMPDPLRPGLASCAFSLSTDSRINLLFFESPHEPFIILQQVTFADAVFFPAHRLLILLQHLSTESVFESLAESFLWLLTQENEKLRRPKIFGGGISGFFRPYHFFYDIMPAVVSLNDNKLLSDIPQIFTSPGSIFTNLDDVFDTSPPLVHVLPKQIRQRVLENDEFHCHIGVNFPKVPHALNNRLDSLLRQAARTKYPQPANPQGARNLRLWWGVTGQKRSWVEQVEGTALILVQLAAEYPAMEVIFDGWTSPTDPSSGDEREVAADEAVVAQILARMKSTISTRSVIGKSSLEKIAIGMTCDAFVANFWLFRDLCGWAVFRSCEHGTRCCAVG
jgi:hypothetical protein